MGLDLPLTAFEEYMLADDRPGHPMDFFLRLRFSGRLDRSALQSAWEAVFPRHPLLAAVVQQPARGRPRWRAHAARPTIAWLSDTACVAPLDLRREAGVRAWVVERSGTTELWTQFHHACCDGLGSLAFLEEVLLAYGRDSAAAAPLRPLCADRLPQRGGLRLGVSQWLRRLPRQAVGLLGVWQFLRHRPAPLVPQTTEVWKQPLPASYPALVCGELSEDETEAIRTSARRQGVSVNDLLLRDLLVTLFAWRSRYGWGSPHDWLRVAVPMNLRSAAEAELPAANVVSMVFVDRQAEDGADAAHLLRGIHEQMARIKRFQLGLTFLISLEAARLLPGGMAAQVDPSRSAATTVLTNFGEPLKATPLECRQGRVTLGDATLEAIDLLAPLRPHTDAAVAILTYAGRLQVTLHYDPRPIQADQAHDLIQAFVSRLRAPHAANDPSDTLGQLCGAL